MRDVASPPRSLPANDRFLRACRREPVDRTPVWFMRQAGRYDPQYRALRERYSLMDIFRNAELCARVMLLPVRRLGVDAAVLFADITLPFLGMGVAFTFRENVGPVLDAPLRDAAAVARLQPFEPQAHVPAVLEAIRIAGRESPVPLIGFAGGPFTLASYLIEGGPARDFTETKVVMLTQRATWEQLMERLTEATIAYLGAQVDAGVHAVQLFDSWAGALGPDDYREFVLPHARRIFEAVRALDIPTIHFATGAAGILPLLVEAGGDVLGVDWRIPLDEAWRRTGYRSGIQGNLDPATALAPFSIVAARAAEILRGGADRPGHIFNLGHGVLPGTPPETLQRLVEVVHTYRHEPAGAG
ncbi:MAG: uroporphyrinogen decarboxylase [Armatimonadetes bacterium]|nr:uroporphyrinogen decarboxylase [Armatimonadota bacterium]